METETGLQVVSVERIDGTDVIVEFSDKTFATYATRLLAGISPKRQQVDPRQKDSQGNGSS